MLRHSPDVLEYVHGPRASVVFLVIRPPFKCRVALCTMYRTLDSISEMVTSGNHVNL